MTSEANIPNGTPSISDVEIIERFGGIRPMASKLGIAVTTVQGWKERDHIPKGRLPQIIAAAADLGVDIGLKPAPPAESAAAKQPERKPAKQEEPMKITPEPTPEPKHQPEPEAEVAPAPAAGEKTDMPGAVTAPRPAGGVSWIALIVVVLLLGGAILTRPLWEAELYPGGGGVVAPADSGRLDDIEAAIQDLGRELNAGSEKLSRRIDALEAGGGESGAAFAAQLAEIEQAMNALSSKLTAGQSTVESRISRLEANEGEVPERVTARLLAIDAAIEALTGSTRGLEGGLATVGGTVG
ncbi:MAG: WXG100 family type VII secretion target, partial [Alphaproteobacteria bacterium]|nr:WXG100 family type VII secretion target [Alphaproteobacteria bacterium]